MSNGKVIYPRFKIGKNSELVAATQNHIMELHGPNPKGVTTSCFYMIVEFEEPMSPKLIPYDAGLGMILSITRQPMMMIPESWYSISRWRQGIIQPSTTRRRILMRRNTLATGRYFWYCIPSIIFLSQSHNLSSSCCMLQKRWCSHAPNLRSRKILSWIQWGQF